MPAELSKPRIGLLALTLELYEQLLPELRAKRERWLREAVLPDPKESVAAFLGAAYSYPDTPMPRSVTEPLLLMQSLRLYWLPRE